MSYVDDRDRRALPDRRQAAADPGGLARQAHRGRHGARRRRRDRHPRRRRDRRRDVVAVRRPGRAERDRPGVLRAHPPTTSATPRCADPFHVSANTDPKGDRSKRPQDQDPDVLLHVVARDRQRHRRARRQVRDRGGLRQPGVRQADDRRLGQRRALGVRVGFVADMGAPGHQAHLPLGFAGRGPAEDYPLSNRFDEIDTMIVFDDVEIPWENVLLLPAHPGGGVHPRDAAPLQHVPVRPAAPAVRRPAGRRRATPTRVQTGVKMHQGVREKLAELACYREGINAHLTAAIELAEASPGGLLMPNQALLYTGRVLACTQLPAMMHLARDLCGGQLCVTPERGHVRRSRGRAVAGQVSGDRRRRRRGSAAAVRVRPRPAQLRLRRAPADVPAVRPVAARSRTCWPSTTTTTSTGPADLVRRVRGARERAAQARGSAHLRPPAVDARARPARERPERGDRRRGGARGRPRRVAPRARAGRARPGRRRRGGDSRRPDRRGRARTADVLREWDDGVADPRRDRARRCCPG